MGRTTYDSIGRPLPGRTTIVLTRDPAWSRRGRARRALLDDALDLAEDLPGDVMVVGGAQVYAAALPVADEQVLTEVPPEPEGDVLYPASTAPRGPRPAASSTTASTAVWERVWLERVGHDGEPRRMVLRTLPSPTAAPPYDDRCRRRGRLGFGAFFRSDHYLGMGADGLPGPSDAWMTLAGLARETSTIRLGTLMTSATFRRRAAGDPVANVDQMSGGRVELGSAPAGSGGAHGVRHPVPGTGERFDRFEEQLAIITGLWRHEGGFSHDGSTTDDSPACQAAPRTRRCCSGRRQKRTPAPAAAYVRRVQPAVRRRGDRARRRQFAPGPRGPATGRRTGRPRHDAIWSNALVLCVGADEAELDRRAAAIGAGQGRAPARTASPAPRRGRRQDRRGTPPSAAERLYLQVLDLADLDHLRLVAAEVMPHV